MARQPDSPANRLAELLPERLMTLRNGSCKRHFRRPSVAEVVAVDPSEAICLIPPACRCCQTTLARCKFAAPIRRRHPAHAAGRRGANFADATAEPYLRSLMAAEDELYRAGQLPHDFACVMARSPASAPLLDDGVVVQQQQMAAACQGPRPDWPPAQSPGCRHCIAHDGGAVHPRQQGVGLVAGGVVDDQRFEGHPALVGQGLQVRRLSPAWLYKITTTDSAGCLPAGTPGSDSRVSALSSQVASSRGRARAPLV